jgi:hypothetical protein
METAKKMLVLMIKLFFQCKHKEVSLWIDAKNCQPYEI